MNSKLLEAFYSSQQSGIKLLPLSRIANISTGTLAPTISMVLALPELRDRVAYLINVSVRAAAASVDLIPELAAESSLPQNHYDIRGTMRGPGGEDHVGILALMRLVIASNEVARVIGCLPNCVTSLCNLHQKLKDIEQIRGKGVDHGQGVTPKSRRILLNAICQIELISEGQGGASRILMDLFQASCAAISSWKGNRTLGEHEMFQITESALDLASFPSTIICSLFNGTDSLHRECLEVLLYSCTSGYQFLGSNCPPEAKYIQVTPLLCVWDSAKSASHCFYRLSGTESGLLCIRYFALLPIQTFHLELPKWFVLSLRPSAMPYIVSALLGHRLPVAYFTATLYLMTPFQPGSSFEF